MINENVFDHNPNKEELDALEIDYNTNIYLTYTTPMKQLTDLYLLFLMRNDSEECSRVIRIMQDIVKEESTVI